MKCCNRCCPGSISPVKATEGMRDPVGIRDGQLYTYGAAAVEDMVAPEYDNTAMYYEGDFVVFENKLYVALAETSGVFDPNSWAPTDIAEEIAERDEELAEQSARIAASRGVRGSVVLTLAGWEDNVQTKTIAAGVNDVILFWTATKEDKEVANNAELDVSTSGNTSTFSVAAAPAADIHLNYVVVKADAAAS